MNLSQASGKEPFSQTAACVREKYTTSLSTTFKQALPHFLRLKAEPCAVGEIQREAGFRQRVLRFLVVHHKSGGAVHGAENLEGSKRKYSSR